MRSRRGADDRGSADALGLTLLAPAAIGLALVIVFLGRGVDSRATVQAAAEAAAQAAAQERSPAAAVAAAEQGGAAMLTDPMSCSDPGVFVDLSAFAPGGQVVVTVSCTVSDEGLEPIAPPPLGPTTATAFATIDPLRATQGMP
ncbi:MAG TPA: hypothetical protein VK860_08560 [Ilumatobacteraceae bacterium]|nr:hypothetical protein [Ilumatobacteraceae bacterium]